MSELATAILARLRSTAAAVTSHTPDAPARFLGAPEADVRAALAGLAAQGHVRGTAAVARGPYYEITAQERRALAAP